MAASTLLFSRLTSRLAPRSSSRPSSPAGGRRALAAQDRRSARLAELTLIGDVLRDAKTVIDRGWLQHDWFGPDDGGPEPERDTDSDTESDTGRPPLRACLVGAVILAAGGPQTRQSQLVQRGLDVVWHAFTEDPATPVLFCPPSNVRMARVRHLTSWNDEARRHPDEVTALLDKAAAVAGRERDRLLPHGAHDATPLTAPRR